ncbi:hypothetical protein R1flu_015102 [Riccia fluitans]|uniref:Uncharacterized protein n=1 Tax=Riccia fluitans TaxID=41844 RepID=A0ABD1YHZ6_9MARC
MKGWAAVKEGKDVVRKKWVAAVILSLIHSGITWTCMLTGGMGRLLLSGHTGTLISGDTVKGAVNVLSLSCRTVLLHVSWFLGLYSTSPV